MATKKKRDQDRGVMDAASVSPDKVSAQDFLSGQADDDRMDAKAKHANKGLKAAKDMVATMAKAIAHGLASDSDSVKLACLEEIADLGNSVRDGSRAAIRSAKSENRNLQGDKA
jgi:hypothetical protein